MSDATYKIKGETGYAWAKVSVSWSRKYGRCDQRRHTRNSDIYTQKNLRAWARRNKVEIPEEDIQKLPKEV